MNRDEPTMPASPGTDEPASRAGAVTGGERRSSGMFRRVRMILWVVATIALFGYIAFGSVPAYTWRFGRLHQDARQVRGIWTVQASNLPDVSPQWAINGIFYGALVVFLLGVTLGLWYLLSSDDNEASTIQPASSPGAGHPPA